MEDGEFKDELAELRMQPGTGEHSSTDQISRVPSGFGATGGSAMVSGGDENASEDDQGSSQRASSASYMLALKFPSSVSDDKNNITQASALSPADLQKRARAYVASRLKMEDSRQFKLNEQFAKAWYQADSKSTKYRLGHFFKAEVKKSLKDQAFRPMLARQIDLPRISVFTIEKMEGRLVSLF